VSDYFGIIINNSEAVNEVYKNDFEGLSYANFSDGKNWNLENRYEGLAYYCNENLNNYADFYVNDFEFDKHSGIQSEQGNDNYTAGNTFTQNGATWHFYNGGEHLVGYYYNQNIINEIPDYYDDDIIYRVAKVGRNVTNNCPSHYGNSELELVLTPQQKADAEQDYYYGLADYNNVKSLYDSYIDGGDTESEKLDIQTAQPDDMWALRAQLLGDSPHLSFDVLKEAADKTDVFTESALFDILAANPDELKKDTLISYLENKEEPLPDYMINLLKQLAEGITYKTALQQQMAGYKHSYSRAAHDIIRSNLHDTVTDYNELRNWLDNLGGITSDRQIITSYISEGNFTDALALANMLPSLYNLESTELTEHNYYMDMLNLHQTLYQQGRNTFQLNSNEKADILFIANNSNGVAGAQAKSILEAVYNEYYVDCPDADGAAGYKSSNKINPDALGKAYGLNISVKPNPAKQWAAFDYTLPNSETKALITITNTKGSTVEILEVNGQQGQKLWDTRSIKPGVYIYTLKIGGFSQSGKIVISK
ncbi:MAG: T9SS type A sorting domain-containing protein, partial [Bacteroidota bacterium]|nr:T9SS type A sorting domain-containing protein [Bacteroidota bacterium]